MGDIESINDALIACVKAAGGSKEVGSLLWPEKPITESQRLLLSCLNTDRAEKLSPDQAALIMRYAKQKGSHVGIEYLCQSLGYSIPTPIEPEDEKAALQREFIAATKAMTLLSEKLQAKGILKAVA